MAFTSSPAIQYFNFYNRRPTDVPEHIRSCETYPSSVQEPTQLRSQRPNLPPPVTDNNLPPSLGPTFKTALSSSELKKYFSIFDLKRLNPALVLQNSGSVARDHLASERTFLAYIRTSLGLASAGIGIVQLLTITDFTAKASSIPTLEANRGVKRFAVPLGIVTLMFSLFLLFLGVFRYFAVQHALPKNMFPAAGVSIIFTSFIFGAFIVAVFGVLLNENMGNWW